MKKRLLYILLLIGFTAQAESMDELRSLLNKAKNPYETPDGLFRIMENLSAYETKPLPGQDSLMLDIYRTVSKTFLTYSHYKKAYQVFNRYLAYKEKMLARNKSLAISTTMNSVGERSRNDDTDLIKLQNQLKDLKEENSSLSKRIVVYKSNFSLAMIILSIVFAVILVGYGIKSFSLRSRLNQNRGTMKNIHKLAVTGRYEEGVRTALQQSMNNVENEIAEIQLKIRN